MKMYKMMKLALKLFGTLLVLAGILILINPNIIYGLMDNNSESLSLYITAIVVRFILGFLLLKTANESKYPIVIKILGFVSIIAASAFILIGQLGFQDLISSLIPLFKPYGRIAGLMSMAFGGFLIYAFAGNKELENENK